MPLLKLNSDYVEVSDRYLNDVIEAGNFYSLVYRMDIWPLIYENGVTSTRTGITPRAAKLMLPGIDEPDYTLISVLFSFHNGTDYIHYDEEEHTAILNCPSGDIKRNDGGCPYEIYGNATELRKLIYPLRDSENEEELTLPDRVLTVINNNISDPYKPKVKDIISDAKSMSIRENFSYPSRSYLTKKLKEMEVEDLPSGDEFIEIYGNHFKL